LSQTLHLGLLLGLFCRKALCLSSFTHVRATRSIHIGREGPAHKVGSFLLTKQTHLHPHRDDLVIHDGANLLSVRGQHDLDTELFIVGILRQDQGGCRPVTHLLTQQPWTFTVELLSSLGVVLVDLLEQFGYGYIERLLHHTRLLKLKLESAHKLSTTLGGAEVLLEHPYATLHHGLHLRD